MSRRLRTPSLRSVTSRLNPRALGGELPDTLAGGLPGMRPGRSHFGSDKTCTLRCSVLRFHNMDSALDRILGLVTSTLDDLDSRDCRLSRAIRRCIRIARL